MNEDFLYYLWKHQKFDKNNLVTTSGNSFEVVKPGLQNSNSGPDFSEGHIKIDNISWYGQVEMHIRSSEWDDHNHQTDPAYNNVILHVVWENDKEILRQDGSAIPTIELKDRVNSETMSRYRLLKEALDIIPCRNQAKEVDQIHFISMLERCTGSRLKKKAEYINSLLDQSTGDWEETAYQLTLKYLGFKINAYPMEHLSRMIPLKTLKKNVHQQKTIEALLFGQAGLLYEPKDDYAKELKNLYDFNKIKYNLPEPLKGHLWKFMRMRPANFPTLRLAQFAAVIVKHPHLFNDYLHENNFIKFRDIFHTEPSAYWQKHYHFSSKVERRNASMGIQALNLLVINVVAPLRAAYAVYTDNYSFMDSASELLQRIPFEKNKVIKSYYDIPIPTQSAFDSQGALTLFEDYCKEKRCLNCDVGVSLLKK